MSAERSFLDTNVLVYCFLDGEREKRVRARALVRESLGRRNALISYQVVQEFLTS